jgi:PIN domain nuclease of toxin-antitoxin system
MKALGIAMEHAALVAALPFHHRDPFDRLLVAQSIKEQMAIVSADTALDAYGITRLW